MVHKFSYGSIHLHVMLPSSWWYASFWNMSMLKVGTTDVYISNISVECKWVVEYGEAYDWGSHSS